MHEKSFQAARFLLVDDEPANVEILKEMLDQWGCCNVESTCDSREALPRYLDFQPDIILLDLMMPYLDGFEVMEQLKPVIPEQSYLPILVLTADASPEIKRRALAAGAKDFLTKPFDLSELLLRMRNLLETRFLHIQLQGQNQTLEIKVLERTADLASANSQIVQHAKQVEESQIEVVERLARAAEYRDDDTGQHTQRVALAAALLARELGFTEEKVDLIQRAAPLHDVGKISVSDLILLKPGRLTDEEFAVMKAHAEIGAAMLAGGRSPLVQTAERIALTHHERWDGSGYPRGLSGEAIPIEGRLVAIADVFDALTHERPYKRAWSIDAAIAEITQASGRQFDPAVVQAFQSLPHEKLL
jgi:putative two-component system response regulator